MAAIGPHIPLAPSSEKIDLRYYLPAMPPLRLLESVHRLYNAWNYRRRLASLLNYDDHILEDMGYTRAELQMAIRLPLSRDPRPLLKEWKALRRVTG